MSHGADQDRRIGRLPILAGRLLATAFTAFILLFAIGEAATEGLGLSAEASAWPLCSDWRRCP